MKSLKFDMILLTVATIWGLAFVAQRMGMDHVGPYTFNGIRFALGGMSLLPFLIVSHKKKKQKTRKMDAPGKMEIIKGSMLSGIVLFAGTSLQQIGLIHTTAGKAGFITGLYVVLVPIIGLFLGQRANMGIWAGAFLASAGLYLLSVTEAMTINFGDLMELCGAFCFALHVIIIARLTNRIDTVTLSFIQCMVCCVASLTAAIALETITITGIWKAALPIFYGGVFSVGIAYSLQIYGQKGSHPAHAAILLSLESLIAAVGGWIILNEILSGRAMAGCALMMGGMLLSQLYRYIIPEKTAINASVLSSDIKA